MQIHADHPYSFRYDARCPFGGHPVKNIVWVDEERQLYGELDSNGNTITKRGLVELAQVDGTD